MTSRKVDYAAYAYLRRAIPFVVFLILTVNFTGSSSANVFHALVMVHAYDIQPRCTWELIRQHNPLNVDNALLEINVVYPNGSTVPDAEIIADAFLFSGLHVAKESHNTASTAFTWCYSLFATIEYSQIRVASRSSPAMSFRWQPRLPWEHLLLFFLPEQQRIDVYHANKMQATSALELAAFAGLVTAVAVVAIVLSAMKKLNRSG